MHYFVDHTQITAQVDTGATPDMKFGPDATTPATQFNITTQHQLTAATKAFACQEGMMVVQRNDSDSTNLVNVIIKPLQPTQVKGLAVRYYVYRGLDINSFFTVSGGVHSIIPNGTANNSEFLTAFWTNEADRQAADPNYVAPTALNLGYGADNLALTDPNNLNEDRSIDDLFDNKAPAIAARVEDGAWLGNFSDSAKIGFDIVLESDLVIPSELKLFRASTRSIQTGALTGLELRRKKEEILAFIDPAAFFGLHYQDGVTGVDTTAYVGNVRGATTNRTTPGSLYPQIVEKYTNKNRVYVDIRSEHGMSYNFYETYEIGGGNQSNIRLQGANVAAAVQYGTDGWPLHIVTTSTVVTNSRKNRFTIRLRRDGNTEPVLFFENKNYTHSTDRGGSRKHFIKGDDITENGVADWTASLSVYYPNDNTTSDDNLATHIKMYYYLRAPVTAGTDRLHVTKYYDAAFCPIDFPGLGDPDVDNGWVESPNARFIKEALQTDGTGNFAITSRSGAYWDDTKVLLYAASLDKKVNNSEKFYHPTVDQVLSMTNTKYTALRNQFEIINRQYQRNIGGTNTDFRIMGINDYVIGNNHKEKEDLMLLGITPAELLLVQGVAGLSDHHPKYIYLSPTAGNPQYDTTTQHHRYHEYTINVQGITPAGVTARIATTVVVYSRDNVFFNSNAFAALEDLSDGTAGLNASEQNRIEYHVYDNGDVKVNDNIDLALLRKSTVTGEHTVADDAAIAGDQSIAQQIYFMWHPAVAAGAQAPAPTQIISFNAVMANKMKRSTASRGGIVNTIPTPEFTLSITYSLGYARRSFTSSTNSDIISTTAATGTGGTKRRYINKNKKVFLAHFVTPLTTTDPNRNNVFDATNNTLGLVFTYSGSRRRYVDIPLCAAFLGVLIRYGQNITSTGFAFGDASSSPSTEHVNGKAIDTLYTNLNDDVDFIEELHHFGIDHVRIGNNFHARSTNIWNHASLANIRNGFILRDSDCRAARQNETPNCQDRNGNTTRVNVTSSLHSSHIHAHERQ